MLVSTALHMGSSCWCLVPLQHVSAWTCWPSVVAPGKLWWGPSSACRSPRAVYSLLCSLLKLPQWWAQAGRTAAAESSLYVRAAVKSNEKGPSNGKLFTEEDWNVESKCDKAGAYSHSKVCVQLVDATGVMGAAISAPS